MKRAKALMTGMLVGASFSACDKDPVAPNGDPQITLSADSVAVAIYESSSPVPVTVRDGSGEILYVPLQYVTRDKNVATVNGNGAISAVSLGSTYIVAALLDRPDVRDSVRVRVYADSCSGLRPDFGVATAADRDLFSYDVNAPLNLQKAVVSTSNGVEVSNVSYTSPDGGVVKGRMWDPVTRTGLRPGIVLMHGLPGTGASMAFAGQSYAEDGAVVIEIDAPWNRRAGPELTHTYQDRVEQITVIKDLQRAVDVLRAHPNVDDERIAFVGFSWGGATGALFVGIERRLKTAALVVGHGGQVSHVTGPVGHQLVANIPCGQRVAWTRAMSPVEPIRFVGNANVPLLLQNGLMDQYIPNPDAVELHAAAPDPKAIMWYNTTHSLNGTAVIDRLNWLREKIGLDP